MQGRLKATLADLAILSNFVPQVEKAKGKVKVNVALDGTLAAPKVQGQILVQNTAANLPDLGLELKNFNADIHSTGKDTLLMLARVESGKKGQLKVVGKVDKLLSAKDRKVYLKIIGKNFEVINIPEAWGLASPKIKVVMVPGHLDVTGEVFIPEVMVTLPKAESSAVALSKDVVIKNPKNPAPEEEKISDEMAISTNIKIILGKKIKFEGAGFQSHFGGTLIASNEPGKPMVGNGELYIIGGSYKAYGQNLRIDRGRVFFSGGRIENPGLDIPAYRRIKQTDEDDIIAGVRIQGTAESPQLVLYSQPQLDQSNILSYIILGKPVAEASKSQGNLLLNAATSLSLKGGDSLAKTIGESFGLDEVSISSDDDFEQSALEVGKCLTEDLCLKYGIGLFDGSKVLRMNYQLMKGLALETETGEQSGADLRYTLER